MATRLTGGNTPADGADPRTFPVVYDELVDEFEAFTGAGFQFREYDDVTGWPERGTVPTGAIVVWVKRDPTAPDPPLDATYALAGTDIALLAQPA